MPIPAGALTVDAVSQGAVMTIIVDTTGMPAGPLLVWGEAGGRSWWVRGARGGTPFTSGDVFFLTDPLAPINTPIQYYVQSPNGEVAGSSTTSRSYDGQHLLTDLSGREHVDFKWRGDGDDRWELGARGTDFEIPGRSSYVSRYDVLVDGKRPLPATTTGANTTSMLDLLSSGAPVIRLYNPGAHSQGYDGDPVLVGRVSQASASHRFAAAAIQRLWDLSLSLLDDPLADTITPLSTIADFNAYWTGLTIADHDAEWSSRTISEHSRVVWSA